MAEAKDKRAAPSPRPPGFRPQFVSRPRAMLAWTVVLAIVATLGMLALGQAPLNLYQGF